MRGHRIRGVRSPVALDQRELKPGIRDEGARRQSGQIELHQARIRHFVVGPCVRPQESVAAVVRGVEAEPRILRRQDKCSILDDDADAGRGRGSTGPVLRDDVKRVVPVGDGGRIPVEEIGCRGELRAEERAIETEPNARDAHVVAGARREHHGSRHGGAGKWRCEGRRRGRRVSGTECDAQKGTQARVWILRAGEVAVTIAELRGVRFQQQPGVGRGIGQPFLDHGRDRPRLEPERLAD